MEARDRDCDHSSCPTEGSILEEAPEQKQPFFNQTNDEAKLPLGWQEIFHGSGIKCYFHEESSVITWSKPYVVNKGSFFDGTLVEYVSKKHMPPLTIFQPEFVQVDDNPAPKKKQKQSSISTAFPTSTTSIVTSSTVAVNNNRQVTLQTTRETIEWNGLQIDLPDGKSINAILRDYAMAAWKVVPHYTQTFSDDPENPIRCTVRIDGKDYADVCRPSKPTAKLAAAAEALEKIDPKYVEWLKKEGRLRASTKPKEKNTGETLSLEEFKQLSLGDARVLQGCMDHCIKTPAQILQEYQNRHRGIAVNYNTIPTDQEGGRVFRTIVSVGNTVAEGTASSKKHSKQLGAQALLELLHADVLSTYWDMVQLYSGCTKVVYTKPPSINKNRSHPAPNPPGASPQLSTPSTFPVHYGENVQSSYPPSGPPECNPYSLAAAPSADWYQQNDRFYGDAHVASRWDTHVSPHVSNIYPMPSAPHAHAPKNPTFAPGTYQADLSNTTSWPNRKKKGSHQSHSHHQSHSKH